MARMKTNWPAQKVIGGSIGGAVSTIVIYVLNEYVLSAPLPAEIAAAVTTLVVALVGYYVPPHARDVIEDQDLTSGGPLG